MNRDFFVKENDSTREDDLKADYVPRIMFLNNLGHFDDSIFNENGNPEYKFFYSNENDGEQV
jgi:hypothetical protein